ncbi:tetratricopeptide repeat protein [Pseudomonas luteola]
MRMPKSGLISMLCIALLAGCSSFDKNPYTSQSLPENGLPVAASGTPVEHKTASASELRSQELIDQAQVHFANRRYDQGIALLEQASELGNASADYELAKHYVKGDYVRQDDKKANFYLVRGDQRGNIEATRVLAWQNLRGSGTPKNIERGKALFDKAAQSSIRAQREAGLLYIGVFQPYLNNPVKGASLLKSAYDQGDAVSAYYYSKAVRKASPQEANAALVFAGKAGYPKALLDVSRSELAKGNMAYASASMLKAAMGGDRDAMYEYANNVLLGRFPSKDREAVAYTWFSIANDYKQPKAAEEMVALEGIKNMYQTKRPGYLTLLKQQSEKMIHPWGAES